MDRIKVKGKTITLKLKIRAKDAPVETAKFLGKDIFSISKCFVINKNGLLQECLSVEDVPNRKHTNHKKTLNIDRKLITFI